MTTLRPPVLRPPASADNTTTVNPPCTGCSAASLLPEPHPPQRSYVHFRHPGYDDTRNLMFRLESFDRYHIHHTLGTPYQDCWGIHHGTALRACSIIACNLEGFLSPTRLTTPTGTETPAVGTPSLVPPPHLDDVLTGTNYYFYPLSGADEVYPVCSGFEHWPFPHTKVPREWTELYPQSYNESQDIPAPSQYAATVAMRDGSCRVSGYGDSSEIAHLVPRDEREWFMRNEMQQYNLNLTLSSAYITSDIENCLRLRGDVHTSLDRGDFVIVPKCGSSYVNMLKRTVEYGRLYHNRATQDIHVTCEFLYARFAWAVLPMASVFASREGVHVQNYDSASNSWQPALAQQAPNKRRRGNGTQGPATSVPSVEVPAPAPEGNRANPVGLRSGGFRPPPPSEVFEKMITAFPQRSWEHLKWHPETPRMNVLREDYLCAHEPLHAAEVKRQNSVLGSDVMLWESSSDSGTDGTM